MTDKKLEPCPFCNGVCHTLPINYPEPITGIYAYIAGCPKCRIYTDQHRAKLIAINTWNKRPLTYENYGNSEEHE